MEYPGILSGVSFFSGAVKISKGEDAVVTSGDARNRGKAGATGTLGRIRKLLFDNDGWNNRRNLRCGICLTRLLRFNLSKLTLFRCNLPQDLDLLRGARYTLTVSLIQLFINFVCSYNFVRGYCRFSQLTTSGLYYCIADMENGME